MSVTTITTGSTRKTYLKPTMKVSILRQGNRLYFMIIFNEVLDAPNGTSFKRGIPADTTTIGQPRTKVELFVRATSWMPGIANSVTLYHTGNGSVLCFTSSRRNAIKALKHVRRLRDEYLSVRVWNKQTA